MQHHGAGMAHGVGIGLVEHVDVVAGRQQAVDEIAVETRLHAQIGVRGAPGAAEQPARRIERRIERLAEHDVAGEHGGLRLRLAVAAHGAVGDDAAVLERGQRRVERVERTGGRARAR